MLNNISAIFFSTIEIFSMLYFATSLFKITINKKRFYKLSVICISFAIFSIFTRIYNLLPTIMPFIQIVIIIFLVNKILKIKIKTASIMVSVSWIIFIAGQTLFVFLLNYYKLIIIEEVQKLTIDGYIVQLSSFIIFMGIGIVTRAVREGYIIDFENSKIKFKYSYKVISIILSTFYLFLISLAILIFSTHNINYVDIFCVLICIFTFVMLIILLERDKEEVKLSFDSFQVRRKEDTIDEIIEK